MFKVDKEDEVVLYRDDEGLMENWIEWGPFEIVCIESNCKIHKKWNEEIEDYEEISREQIEEAEQIKEVTPSEVELDIIEQQANLMEAQIALEEKQEQDKLDILDTICTLMEMLQN